MRRLWRPEDGRFSRLSDIRSLSLPSQEQRVRVGVLVVVHNPPNEGKNSSEEQGRVRVPARQKVGDGRDKLLDDSRHGRGCKVEGRARRSKSKSCVPPTVSVQKQLRWGPVHGHEAKHPADTFVY